MSRVRQLRTDPRAGWAIGALIVLAVALMPLFRPPLDGFTSDAILALAYVVMALGLNLVVGFAGLLDLGYVAFYAFGLMVTGWWASDFYSSVNGEKGIHVGVSDFVSSLPGIHFNFLILVVGAIIICAVAGIIIGLPTLRLRGDYIAIVTLAFGEIIGRVFANGDTVTIFGDDKLSNGRQSISPIDQINLPGFGEFDSATSLRPYYWCVLALCLVVLFVNFRLRDSRLGRAWIALREDEVAAASMGVPLVKTKLLSYAAGGAFGGISGVLPGAGLRERQRQRVPVRLLDLHPRDGHPRRARQHLGGGARRCDAGLREPLADPRRARRHVRAGQARLARTHLPVHRGLVRGVRLHPALDDGAQTRGPDTRAPAQAGAGGGTG